MIGQGPVAVPGQTVPGRDLRSSSWPDRNAAPDPAAIVAAELVKTYPGGVQAVRGISFSVAAGESFGLLGPNGAGKPNPGLRHFFVGSGTADIVAAAPPAVHHHDTIMVWL
jgi:hypothetical protein